MTVRTLTFLQRATIATVVGCSLSCAPIGAQNAMLREAEFGQKNEIVDPNGNFRTAVSLPFAVELDSDGELTIEIPLAGSEIPVYCLVGNNETQLGVSVLRITRAIVDTLRENFEISSLRTAAVDGGAIGGTAYQLLSTSFVLQGDGESGVGLMKVASANKQGRSIHCNHWDAGFIETFERVFSELVRNFQVAAPPPIPFYTEVSRIQFGETPVGVGTLRLTRDVDGDIEAVSESSTLIPTSESDFQGLYSKAIDWAHDDGTLINSYAFKSDIEGENTSIALKWDDERGWYVQGLYENKEIAHELDHGGPIDSSVTDWLVLRHKLVPQGDESRVSLKRWIPAADPTRVIEVSFDADPEDARLATMITGALEMRLKRGEDGLPESTIVSVGNILMTIERIFRNDEP